MSFSTIVKDELSKIITTSECCLAPVPTKNMKVCCKKTFLRKVFLSNGTICDPNKSYHLEIIIKDFILARKIINILKCFNIIPKSLKRSNNFVIYIKESEDIVDFLNVVGAHSALLELENIRILKDVKNNINRIVNCETANIEKTISAALRQIENIKYISSTIGLDKLPSELQEIAKIRLSNAELSLKEIGEKHIPKIGKSSVNNRLQKMDQIAYNLRRLKGEL